jgi:hypothetical protein
MSQRRWAIVVAAVILAAVGAELVFRHWYSSSGCVQVVNEGDGPVDNLVIRYADTRVARGTLGVSQSTNVWLTSSGKGTLSLEYQQKGNSLRGFEVQDFDPAENLREGFKLVLVIKPNIVERLREEDPSTIALPSLGDRIMQWIHTDLLSRH